MRGAFRQGRASGGLPVFDEAWKGYVVLCDVKLGDVSGGVWGAGLVCAEYEL